jgi:hypothetical protein
MPDVRLPLSGNVTQSINPWNWMFNPVSSQFGVLNVNLGQSSDPEAEQRILENVGSYGKQLGAIGDVLRVLLDHVKLDKLTPKEKTAIDTLRKQLDAVDEVKAQPPTHAGTNEEVLSVVP